MWQFLLLLIVIIFIVYLILRKRDFVVADDAKQIFHEYVMSHPDRIQYGKDCCNLDLTDPSQTENYFKVELKEPEHADIVSGIKNNNNIFSNYLMKKWISEEENK